MQVQKGLAVASIRPYQSSKTCARLHIRSKLLQVSPGISVCRCRGARQLQQPSQIKDRVAAVVALAPKPTPDVALHQGNL